MSRASGDSYTPQRNRDDSLDLLRAMPVKISVKDGKISKCTLPVHIFLSKTYSRREPGALSLTSTKLGIEYLVYCLRVDLSRDSLSVFNRQPEH